MSSKTAAMFVPPSPSHFTLTFSSLPFPFTVGLDLSTVGSDPKVEDALLSLLTFGEINSYPVLLSIQFVPCTAIPVGVKCVNLFFSWGKTGSC